MQALQVTGVRAAIRAMQWRRGLRAGLAVGGAMVACHALGHPMGWAALGGLQVVMVDNGGPYRSRLANVLTVLVGGSMAVGLGVMAGVSLPLAILLTLPFCFVVTLSRVLSQPLASSSAVILVCYIVAHGSAVHTRANGLIETRDFLLGGLWAALLIFALWPADPFRPARRAVATVYDTLMELVRLLPTAATNDGSRQFNEVLGEMRTQIEAAQKAVAATPARMTSRTVRARNLSVLIESADLLLPRILRFAELTQKEDEENVHASPAVRGNLIAAPQNLSVICSWLQESLAPIAPVLRQRPPKGVSAFEPYGSESVEMHRSMERVVAVLERDPQDDNKHLAETVRDSLLHLEVCYAAVCAVWSGVDTLQNVAGHGASGGHTMPQAPVRDSLGAMWDSLYGHCSLNSVMFRHAIRLALVVTIDVTVTHFVKFSHGYWLAMTSLIVLQPYTGETVRRSGERVLGTVAGGVLASMFAASIHSQIGLIAGVTVGSVLAIALYAVDYAWYCFFLTPTIVLITLPHLRDWHFAAVRMGMTLLGATVAVAAMLLLWPERESLELPGLLARAAEAEAAYLRAVIAFWKAVGDTATAKIRAERQLLAPARRNCGLATNDAEDTLDRALIEHAIPLNPAQERTEKLNRAALTFTSYLRRLTQTITTLAATGNVAMEEPLQGYIARLEVVSGELTKKPSSIGSVTAANNTDSPTELLRMDRQIAVLERMATGIAGL